MYVPGLGNSGVFEKGQGAFEDGDNELVFNGKGKKRRAPSPFVSFQRVRGTTRAPYIATSAAMARAVRAEGVPSFMRSDVMVPRDASGRPFMGEGAMWRNGSFVFPNQDEYLRNRYSEEIDFTSPDVTVLSPRVERFAPVDPQPLRKWVKDDIRSLVEPYGSAAGLGQSAIDKLIAATGIDRSVIDAAIATGKDARGIYKSVTGKRKPVVQRATQDQGQPAPLPPLRLEKPGMSAGTIALIAGGGIAVVALAALLLRRK